MAEKKENENLRADKLFKLISEYTGRIIAIVSHIDLDSIGALMLMKRLVKFCGKSLEIYYAGEPGHLQNEAAFDLFALHRIFKPISQIAVGPPPEGAMIILLDSPTLQDNRCGAQSEFLKTWPVHVVIDHHTPPENIPEENENTFWCYGHVGSTCTLIGKICHDLEVSFEKNDEKEIATLGAIGILGDTNGLSSLSTTPLDSEAFAFLHSHAEQEWVHAVFFTAWDDESLAMLNSATDIKNRTSDGITLVVCLDEIPYKKKDWMASIADILIAKEKVSTVFVWAISLDNEGNTRLLVKVRNTNKKVQVNLDKFLKAKFGADNGGAKDGGSGAASRIIGSKDMPSDLGNSSDRKAIIQAYKPLLNDILLR